MSTSTGLIWSRVVRHRWLLLSLVVAAMLRLWCLHGNPPALNQDEAVGGYDAFCLGRTLRDHHGNLLPFMLESFEDWTSPLLTYLTVPFVWLLGLSETSIRLPSALGGVASVYLMAKLSRQVLPVDRVAHTAAFLLAVAPWHIALSRWAIPPAIVPLALLVTMVACGKAGRRNTAAGWTTFIVAAALLTYAYPTQKLFVPLLVGLVCAVYLLRAPVRAGMVLVGYAVLVSPIYLAVWANPARYNARFKEVALDFHHPRWLLEFGERYLEYLAPSFHFGTGDPDWMHHVPGYGAMYALVAPFFYVGVLLIACACFRPPQRMPVDVRWARILMGWLLLFPIPASLTSDHQHLLRAVHGLPLVPLYAAIGLGYVSTFLRSRRLDVALAPAFVLGVSVFAVSFVRFYWGDYAKEVRPHFQYGLREAFGFALAREASFSAVHVSTDVTAPYIFYLFFSRFDPRRLDYSQVNEHAKEGGWLKVTSLGKWHFHSISNEQLNGATEVARFGDANQPRYTAFATSTELFLR